MDNGNKINLMEKDNFFFKMDHIILELFYKVLHMDKVDIYTIMDVFIKEILKIIKQMDLELILILFKNINILDNGKMMYHMEKENKNSKMDPITKEDSFKEQKME
jgi:hypothetical protein